MPLLNFVMGMVRAQWYLPWKQWVLALGETTPQGPAAIINNTLAPPLSASAAGGGVLAPGEIRLPDGFGEYTALYIALSKWFENKQPSGALPTGKKAKDVWKMAAFDSYSAGDWFSAPEAHGHPVLEPPRLKGSVDTAECPVYQGSYDDAKFGGNGAWGGPAPLTGDGASKDWPYSITNDVISNWVSKGGAELQIITGPTAKFSTKPRDLIETDGISGYADDMDPDEQCWGSLVELTTLEPCYICGLPMLNFGGKAVFATGTKEFKTGFACEHVIPIFLMCLICGLNGTVHGIMFAEIVAKITGFDRDAFIEWREACRHFSYQWSHASCNQVKLQYPFIKFDIAYGNPATGPQIISTPLGGNVLYCLYRLLRVDKNMEITWRKYYATFLSAMVGGAPDAEKLVNWANWQANQVVTNNLKPLCDAVDSAPDGTYFSMSICVTVRLMIKKSNAVNAVEGFAKVGKPSSYNLAKLYKNAAALLTKQSLNKDLLVGGGARTKQRADKTPKGWQSKGRSVDSKIAKENRTVEAKNKNTRRSVALLRKEISLGEQFRELGFEAEAPAAAAFEAEVLEYVDSLDCNLHMGLKDSLKRRSPGYGATMCRLILTHKKSRELEARLKEPINDALKAHLAAAHQILIHHGFRAWGSVAGAPNMVHGEMSGEYVVHPADEQLFVPLVQNASGIMVDSRLNEDLYDWLEDRGAEMRGQVADLASSSTFENWLARSQAHQVEAEETLAGLPQAQQVQEEAEAAADANAAALLAEWEAVRGPVALASARHKQAEKNEQYLIQARAEMAGDDEDAMDDDDEELLEDHLNEIRKEAAEAAAEAQQQQQMAQMTPQQQQQMMMQQQQQQQMMMQQQQQQQMMMQQQQQQQMMMQQAEMEARQQEDESAAAEVVEMDGDGDGDEYMATGGWGQCQPCSTNKVYKPPKSSRKKSIKKKKSKKKTKKKYIKKSPKYSTKKSLKKKSFKKGSRKKTLRKKSKRKSKK